MFAISYFYLKKQTKPKQRTIIQPNPFTRHPPFLCFSHTVTPVKGVDHLFIITSSLVIPVQLLQYDFCPIVPQRLVLSRSSMVLMVQNLVNTSWTSSWPFSSIWHSEAPLPFFTWCPWHPRFLGFLLTHWVLHWHLLLLCLISECPCSSGIHPGLPFFSPWVSPPTTDLSYNYMAYDSQI